MVPVSEAGQSWRREAAARLIPLLPENAQKRIVGPATTWRPKDLRQVAKAGEGEKRLLIAPTNYAGQAYLWARAAETIPGVSAHSLQYYDPAAWHLFQADTHVRKNVWGHSHLWKKRQANALADFTHIIVEAGQPILPDGEWSLRDSDIESLLDAGLKVALLWHGTDVRLPSKHMELEPFSPYRQGNPDWVATLERTAQANHDLADRWGLPEFVSNPYLTTFRPDATWVPTLSDPVRWDAAPLKVEGRLPVVAHMPSQRIWKGTDIIRPVLQSLEAQGILRYRDVTQVPTSDMPGVIASSDVVVDGIVNGQYGVASLETMLSRRVAVAHTWESTRAQIEASSGLRVPVVEATPDSFEEVIRELVRDPDALPQLGESGREYVQTVHSPSVAAEALAPFLSD